jgi:hypothetical protein
MEVVDPWNFFFWAQYRHTVTVMKMTVFWDVMLCSMVEGHAATTFYPEDESSWLLQNICYDLPDYAVTFQ